MAGLINLPGYAVPNALNFSGLNAGIDSIRENALAQEQMGMKREQLGMQRESHGVQMRQAKTQQEIAEARQVAGRVQYIQGLPPEQQGQAWQQTLQMPGFKDLPPDMRDFNRAAPALLGRAAEYTGERDRVEIDLKRAQAEKFRREAANGGETPANIREWNAFQGMSEQQRQEYLTMKRAQPWLNQGTQFTQPNPVAPGGPPVASLPIDNAGKATQKAVGAGQGQAIVDLPKVKQNAASTIGYIDRVLKDENLGNVTGWQARLPTLRERSVDTEERIAQLGGRAFLSAFESLKGGGQITEIEGQKATQALARLTNLKQSDKGFKTALQEFRGEIMDLVRLAERKAQGAGPYSPPPGVPTDGVPRENTDRLPPSPTGWSIKRID